LSIPTGDDFETGKLPGQVTFLLRAFEILDDDGLCESIEDCIYTPHLGSYSGPELENGGGELMELLNNYIGIGGELEGIRLFQLQDIGG
jgi:hypothetical protein